MSAPCPQCGKDLIETGHGPYCPGKLCRWGWETDAIHSGLGIRKGTEPRIYVVLPAKVEVGDGKIVHQIPGRLIAQACHVVSKLRLEMAQKEHAACLSYISNRPITTIILSCRDTREMLHVFTLLTGVNRQPTLFADENPEVYGDAKPITAMAVKAIPKIVEGILDYLPLWGAQ